MSGFAKSRWRFAAILVVAAASAAVLIAASQVGAGQQKTARASAVRTPAVRAASRSLWAGVPQRGATLGSPRAPVTLIEYADLQCPYCAQWALRTLPVLVDDYVRPGKLRIVFRGLAFIGPDSERALRAVVAAGRHDQLWGMVHVLYQDQGAENSGWVTDELLRDVAEGQGLDGEQLLADLKEPWVVEHIQRAAAQAQISGVRGTPSFEIGRTGGRLVPVQLRSLSPDGIRPVIERALVR
jgi:protein-disulfide isomerase